MKAGFIGLGHLGKTIAQRLIDEGVTLTVWNRTRDKAAGLEAGIAETPSHLLPDNDIIFVNLFDSGAVQSVMSGKGGLLEGDCRGKIIIDTTTNHFDSVGGFHELCEVRGARYLEAPVLGSVVPASEGKLTVLVSGDETAFETARPYLERIGKNIFYVVTPALATKMKLINNLVLGSFMATLSEAVSFGESAGLDKGKVLEILSAGAGNSGVLNAKREKLLKEDFSPHFSSALIYKDLRYLQDLAFALKRPLFTGSIAKELFAMVYAKNMEHLDFSAVYKVLSDL